MPLSDSVRIGRRFRLREQRGALAIGGEHKIKKRLWPVGRFLRQCPDARAGGRDDAARLRGELAGDHPEQGGLARPVAADQPDARAVGDLC